MHLTQFCKSLFPCPSSLPHLLSNILWFLGKLYQHCRISDRYFGKDPSSLTREDLGWRGFGTASLVLNFPSFSQLLGICMELWKIPRWSVESSVSRAFHRASLSQAEPLYVSRRSLLLSMIAVLSQEECNLELLVFLLTKTSHFQTQNKYSWARVHSQKGEATLKRVYFFESLT